MSLQSSTPTLQMHKGKNTIRIFIWKKCKPKKLTIDLELDLYPHQLSWKCIRLKQN